MIRVANLQMQAGEDGDAQEGEEMPDCNVYDVRDAFCILQYPRDWYQNEEDADYQAVLFFDEAGGLRVFGGTVRVFRKSFVQDRAEDMTESFKDEDQELFQVEMSGLGLWGFCPGEYNKYKIRFWIPLTIIYIYKNFLYLSVQEGSRSSRTGPKKQKKMQGTMQTRTGSTQRASGFAELVLI